MQSLAPWKALGYKAFSRIYFDLFKNSYKDREVDTEIYFRITKPTWKRRGEVVSVVYPKPYALSEQTGANKVFCMVKRTKADPLWISFYEEGIELGMLKTDILSFENGYTISDAFNTTILNGDLKCAAS